jgi:hypothetical protein
VNQLARPPAAPAQSHTDVSPEYVNDAPSAQSTRRPSTGRLAASHQPRAQAQALGRLRAIRLLFVQRVPASRANVSAVSPDTPGRSSVRAPRTERPATTSKGL